MVWPVRVGKRVRDGLLAVLGVAAIGGAAFFVLHEPPERDVRLWMTAGREDGARHLIAQELQRDAYPRKLKIELKPKAGSAEALQAVDSKELDMALVQGGLDMGGYPNLRQVAVLQLEPLHLLVKPGIDLEEGCSLAGLKRKNVNLGELGSGTYALAKAVMAFSGLRAKVDYTETNLSYADLKHETDPSHLPDAVFSVSSLPSPIARHLVKKHHYRLMSLPIHDAFALWAIDEDDGVPGLLGETATRIDRRFIYEATIPAFAYGVEPKVPPEIIQTLGTRLLLVARKEMAASTVRRLLDVLFNSPFSRVRQPPLDVKLLESSPELPWHEGTTEYVHRNSPLIAGDVIDLLEKQVSIVGVVAGGLFCLTQWVRRRYRWRRERSFEAYILQVAQVERRALDLSRAPTLDLAALLQLQDDLARIKGEALERFAAGELDGEEFMSGFLAHASDARDFLVRLILHQRDNLEDNARAQRRPAAALWNEAIGELHHASADGSPPGSSAPSY